MAVPTEKEVETMPTQKIFKQRVRARMTKTGESYTTARRQLLHKAIGVDAKAGKEPVTATPAGFEIAEVPAETPAAPTSPADTAPEDAFVVADDAMLGKTGKRHAEWFALLDAWGGTDHSHTEIARWLSETHGVPGWWTQSVTVAYERARGMRARHQMRDGFSISVTKTVAVTPQRALSAITNTRLRSRWLPGAQMRQRPTRAAASARFDWADPPSRVMVGVAPKGSNKAVVYVTHEQLPDAEAGERMKGVWRASLVELKAFLEGS